MITDQQIEQFREIGYFVTDVVIEERDLRAMTDEIDRVYEEQVDKVRADGGTDEEIRAAKGRRAYGAFHTLSDVAAEFIKQPIYLEASRKLVGPDVDLYYNQVAVKPPEVSKTFGWHQDSGYTTTEPLEYITCWTAIGDSDLDNGCIWVIPGSNKHGVFPHERQEETDDMYGGVNAQFDDDAGAMPVEMKAGQVAIFSSLTLHQSGPNLSKDRTRYGYVPQYHVPKPILVRSGEVFGDQVPILRDGEVVA
jgi:ectoine hydroxylase-related dioxygenase (phytanoyl-CoA dioxygenase family)